MLQKSNFSIAPHTAPPVQFQPSPQRATPGPSFNTILKNLQPPIQKQSLSEIPGWSRDLIGMQMSVAQYQLRVELASKAAESGSSTFKRLQQGG